MSGLQGASKLVRLKGGGHGAQVDLAKAFPKQAVSIALLAEQAKVSSWSVIEDVARLKGNAKAAKGIFVRNEHVLPAGKKTQGRLLALAKESQDSSPDYRAWALDPRTRVTIRSSNLCQLLRPSSPQPKKSVACKAETAHTGPAKAVLLSPSGLDARHYTNRTVMSDPPKLEVRVRLEGGTKGDQVIVRRTLASGGNPVADHKSAEIAALYAPEEKTVTVDADLTGRARFDLGYFGGDVFWIEAVRGGAVEDSAQVTTWRRMHVRVSHPDTIKVPSMSPVVGELSEVYVDASVSTEAIPPGYTDGSLKDYTWLDMPTISSKPVLNLFYGGKDGRALRNLNVALLKRNRPPRNTLHMVIGHLTCEPVDCWLNAQGPVSVDAATNDSTLQTQITNVFVDKGSTDKSMSWSDANGTLAFVPTGSGMSPFLEGSWTDGTRSGTFTAADWEVRGPKKAGGDGKLKLNLRGVTKAIGAGNLPATVTLTIKAKGLEDYGGLSADEIAIAAAGLHAVDGTKVANDLVKTVLHEIGHTQRMVPPWSKGAPRLAARPHAHYYDGGGHVGPHCDNGVDGPPAPPGHPISPGVSGKKNTDGVYPDSCDLSVEGSKAFCAMFGAGTPNTKPVYCEECRAFFRLQAIVFGTT